MQQTTQSNVGVSLICIHQVITRGLTVAQERCVEYERHGFPTLATMHGFVCYVRSLASVMHAHHATEDDLAFPDFRSLLTDAPYDVLAADHRAMEPLQRNIETALDNIQSASIDSFPPSDKVNVALGSLATALAPLCAIWFPHIAKEEQYFSIQRLNAIIDADEHARLNQKYMAHSQQKCGPDYLVVPFMLLNLAGEFRVAFAREMPPGVLEKMIPVVWRNQWEPMAQFLLPL